MQDEHFLDGVVTGLIIVHKDKWKQARKKPELIDWFVGRAMQACDGDADPQVLNSMFRRRLKRPAPAHQ